MSGLLISRFDDQTDTAPKTVNVTWAELVKLLSSSRPCPCTLATCGKKCPHKFGPAWSPAAYPAGASRVDASVGTIGALVLDLDHLAPVDLAPTMARLIGLGLHFIVHSSHSDGYNGEHALRVVIELSEPVMAADWPRFWKAAIDELAPNVDPTTKNPSRIYFLPSHRADAAIVFDTNDGAPLDVKQILAKAPAIVEVSAPSAIEGSLGPASQVLIERARQALQHRGPAIANVPGKPPTNGDNHTFTVCAAMVHDHALTDAEAWPLLLEWNETCVPPWDHDGLKAKMVNARAHASGPYGAARIEFEQSEALRDDFPVETSTESKAESKPTETPRALPSLASEIGERSVPPLIHYSSGIADLDNRMGGGFSTRALHVPISRTGAGKSGLALGVLMHNARGNIPGLYVSTELDDNECFARAAAQQLRVAHRDILSGAISRTHAAESLRGMPLYIVGSEHMKRGDAGLAIVRDNIRRIADLHGTPPIAVLDYLQMLVDTDPKNVRAGIADIANSLRALSQTENCAIIGVSSTGRGFYRVPKEGADDPITYLSAAKESGDIEFAAANIIFLDVGEQDSSGTYSARIVLAKARRGSAGFVGAKFHGPSGRWEYAPEILPNMSGENRASSAQQTALGLQVTKLVARITEEVRADKFLSKTAWRDSGYPNAIRVINYALEINALKVEEILRREAGKLQRRAVVVPADWHPVDGQPRAIVEGPYIEGSS